MAVTAQGLCQGGRNLAGHFTLVATNVPYLARGKQNDFLKDYCKRVHDDAKGDLATCFVERCLSFCRSNGTTALVTPQNWYFLGTYRKFRQTLLRTASWNAVVKLGPSAFHDMNFWAATTAMSIVSHGVPCIEEGIHGWDVSQTRDPDAKAAMLMTTSARSALQSSQLDNPDARIAVSADQGEQLLQGFANGYAGIQSGDYPRFGRCFWEMSEISNGWSVQLSTVEETGPYTQGREHILLWEGGNGELSRSPSAYIRGHSAFGRRGVLVSQMNKLPVCLYNGELFDNNCAVIVPLAEQMLPAIWSFCSSVTFHDSIRQIDQQVKVTNSTLVKVPFDPSEWRSAAAEKYPHGLPKPFSSDPTQWLFNGHPKGFRPAVACGRGAVARLPVAAPDRFKFSRLPGARPGWAGKAGG